MPISVEGLQNSRVIAEMFARKFKVDPQPVTITVYLDNTLGNTSESIHFTPAEVRKLIYLMNKGKSPGHEELSLEHIINAGDKIYSKLSVLFNLCIKYS